MDPTALGEPTRVVTRVFRRDPVRAVAVTVVIGLALLSTALGLGLPPLLATVLFVTALVVCLGSLGGEAVYWLSEAGIHRRWRSLASVLAGGSGFELLVPWTAVRSFRLDRDLSRSLTEVEFLEIDVAGRPRRLLVTARQDRSGFVAFRDAFVARAAGTAGSGGVPLARRPGFFETRRAKVLTAFFVLASVALTAAAATGAAGASSWLRLALVVVPGTAYMVWRSLGRR